MNESRRSFLHAAAGSIGALCPFLSSAQSFPSKTVTIIVPTSAGGPLDAAARMIGQQLSALWGVPVIMDHKTGAGGTIASAALARAPADGHTLMIIQRGVTANPSLYKKLPFDTATDLVPVVILNEHPFVLAVPGSSPFRSVSDVIAAARSRPGQLSFGSIGAGGMPHIAGETFLRSTSTQMLHVPFRGAAPLMTEIIAGRIDMTFNSAASVMAQLKEGKVHALAVASDTRTPLLPDVPTFAELGVKGMNIGSWHALFAPGKTPLAVRTKINTDVVNILAKPEMKKWVANQGAVSARPLTTQEFQAEFLKEISDFSNLLAGLNLQPE